MRVKRVKTARGAWYQCLGLPVAGRLPDLGGRAGLLSGEGFRGCQPGGADGRVEAGERPDEQRGGDTAGAGPGRDDCWPVLTRGVGSGDGDTEQGSRQLGP